MAWREKAGTQWTCPSEWTWSRRFLDRAGCERSRRPRVGRRMVENSAKGSGDWGGGRVLRAQGKRGTHAPTHTSTHGIGSDAMHRETGGRGNVTFLSRASTPFSHPQKGLADADRPPFLPQQFVDQSALRPQPKPHLLCLPPTATAIDGRICQRIRRSMQLSPT